MKEGWEEKARQVGLTWRSKWSRQKIYRIDLFLHPNFEMPNQVDSCSSFIFCHFGLHATPSFSPGCMGCGGHAQDLEESDSANKSWNARYFLPFAIWRKDSYYQPLHSHMSTMLHLESKLDIHRNSHLFYDIRTANLHPAWHSLFRCYFEVSYAPMAGGSYWITAGKQAGDKSWVCSKGDRDMFTFLHAVWCILYTLCMTIYDYICVYIYTHVLYFHVI